MIKYGILSLCLYLTICGAFAQKKSYIFDDLKRYHTAHYEETIYLHTNSSFLLAGETLLFKAYCLNSSDNTPSKLSTIAYVKLIDINSTAVLQAKVLLTDGGGYGDIFLPSALTSGNYTLVAYTNWMKNGDQKKFFKTQITIVNPFRKPTSAAVVKPSVKIEFFPEGGRLVSGVKNTIIFNALNEKHKAVTFLGRVLDNGGSTVAEFTPEFAGKGRFSFTPESNKVYKAVITDTLQNVYFQQLPNVSDEGIALQVEEDETSFHVNLASHSIGKSSRIKVLVHHKSVPLLENDVQFNNEHATLVFKKDILPPGISQITIFNEAGQVVCERPVFNSASNLPLANLKFERKTYKTRERVRMTITVKDTLIAYLSVSVRKLESKIKSPTPITNYLLLENGNSQLGSMARGEALDNQVQIQPVYHVGNSKEPSPIYLPEVRNNLITGTVTKSGSPVQKENVYLTVPSKNYLFLVSTTDSTGRFFFNTGEIKYNTDVILQTSPLTCSECQIKTDAARLSEYLNFTPAPLELDSSFRKIIERKSILAQIENAYYLQKQDSIIDRPSEVRFYGQPDKTYILDDFVRFPTMEDIFIEYVHEVILRKKKNQFEIRVLDTRQRFAFNTNPLILLDGIPIFDNNQVMNYNPLLLKKIEVVGKRYFYGPLEVQGIISLSTYTGEGTGISIAQKEKYVGILPQKEYYSPTYSSGASELDKLPDYRTQLYWNPNVTLSGTKIPTFEFFTSDVKGDFEVVIEGIEVNGKPVHYSDVIHVE